MRLDRPFYARDTLTVARQLLGQLLVRVDHGERISGRIVEVEAYIGEDDLACHAAAGRTARTEVMFGSPGHAYVYLIYGMHHCLNVVTEREGLPAAVLIRALEPVAGLEIMRERRGGRPDRQLTNGPGKLCQALGITRQMNGLDLVESQELFIEEEEGVLDDRVHTTPRVNVRGDERALSVEWRFVVRGHRFASQ